MVMSEEDNIGRSIVNAVFLVHKGLGPRLLERIYEACVAHELRKIGVGVARQIEIPIR